MWKQLAPSMELALVKLMGRHSGFIGCFGDAWPAQHVNFCLIPEVSFELEGSRGLAGRCYGIGLPNANRP